MSSISSLGSEATGLLEGTPIAAGGGDCAAQAVGSAIVREGKVSVTLGTSGVVFAQSDEYRVEPGMENCTPSVMRSYDQSGT